MKTSHHLLRNNEGIAAVDPSNSLIPILLSCWTFSLIGQRFYSLLRSFSCQLIIDFNRKFCGILDRHIIYGQQDNYFGHSPIDFRSSAPQTQVRLVFPFSKRPCESSGLGLLRVQRAPCGLRCCMYLMLYSPPASLSLLRSTDTFGLSDRRAYSHLDQAPE